MGFTARVQFLAGERDFSLLHHVQTDSGANPTSYPMIIRHYFHEGKAAGVRSSPLSTHHYLMLRSRIVELYLHSPTYIHGVVFN
jgi:hypothetical protein